MGVRRIPTPHKKHPITKTEKEKKPAMQNRGMTIKRIELNKIGLTIRQCLFYLYFILLIDWRMHERIQWTHFCNLLLPAVNTRCQIHPTLIHNKA